ncbi:MAG: ImmA/IrrE family metallo-endopeptidase [Actinomycetota bacterium]
MRLGTRLPSGSDCGVAALYEPRERRITVQAAGSDRRNRFSAVHELGHHLLLDDPEAVITIDRRRRHNRASRTIEDTADAFAAELLVPSDLTETVFAQRSPVARDVVALFEQSGVHGSRSACCVRAAQRSPGNGVVLLIRDRTVQFCSVFGDAAPIARGTQQHLGLIDRAVQDGTASTRSARLRHGNGADSIEYAMTAAASNDYVFVAATDRSPTRADELPATRSPAISSEQICETCGEPIRQRLDCCRRVHCDDCPCPTHTTRRTMYCPSCTSTLPEDLFPDGHAICVDCV